MSSRDTGVSKRYNAAELVECYLETVNLAKRAYAILEEAEKVSLGGFGDAFNTLPGNNYLKYGALENVLEKIKQKAWYQIIDRLGIRQVMSIKKAEELDKMLDDAKSLPEITMDTVRQMSEGLVDSAPDFAKEAVFEVFEFLRPGASDYNQHKTNVKNGRYELKEKIILVNMVEGRFGGLHVHYHRDKHLTAVDAVFHQADGKPMKQAYLSPLIDAINTSQGDGETEYFAFKCYGNGNLHLTFKRPDLVAKLNRVAGGAKFTGE